MADLNADHALSDVKPAEPNAIECLDCGDITTDSEECLTCGSDDVVTVHAFACHTEGTFETGCHDPDTHDFGYGGHAEREP